MEKVFQYIYFDMLYIKEFSLQSKSHYVGTYIYISIRKNTDSPEGNILK